MTTYSIYEGHMNDLMKKVNKIKNKCAKFGCGFHFEEVGEEFKEVVVDKDPNTGKAIKGIRRFVIVEAEGTAKLNDWEFIASVEHTEKGNIFSKALTEIEIPARYRTCDPTCEHCNSRRSRKSTFIVHNTITDEFKMVGNSCLMDFTHGLSVSTASWFASLKDVFEEVEQSDDFSFGGWHTKYYDRELVMKYIAETIRHFGFNKSKDSNGWDSPESTKVRFNTFMNILQGNTRWMDQDEVIRIKDLLKKVGFNPESEDAKFMVNSAMIWLNDQEESNDYMHNLKVACSLDYIDSSKFGLLVSLFPTYDKDLERQAQKRLEAEQGKLSEHVGQIGDRIKIDVDSIKCITSWESTFGYKTTMTYIWKINDVNGNVFTWKTATWMDEDNAPKTIQATVKEHKIFREVKQTEVTRCRIQGIA